ncbi:MAG: stage III sporulation protein AF [Lachnospiraceae bacterium]|nr:stage III sporulation protein AF [Lachnospiraceae bacterium]
MTEIFTDLAKRMVIFLIAGQTFLHFGMGKPYERYVKLTISLMLVAQLVSAVFSFLPSFHPGRGENPAKEELISFEEQWKSNQEEFEKKLYQQQSRLEKEWEEKVEEMVPDEADKEENQIKIEEIRIQ